MQDMYESWFREYYRRNAVILKERTELWQRIIWKHGDLSSAQQGSDLI